MKESERPDFEISELMEKIFQLGDHGRINIGGAVFECNTHVGTW